MPLPAIVGINSHIVKFVQDVKIRGIHPVMLEWAYIKDKINTFQKSQEKGNGYSALRECQIDDFQHWMSIPRSLMTPGHPV